MFNIIFPENIGQYYWRIHYEYILNMFKYLECSITYEHRGMEELRVTINDKDFIFDYWNDCNKILDTNLPVFKFHCIKETDKIFAFPTVTFYDWNQYYELKSKINYKAKGYIIYRQRAYGRSTERRNKVKEALSALKNVKIGTIEQLDYWNEVNKCLVSIHVPGFCNNSLDRGQLQLMAFGCCTISPYLPEILPFGHSVTPGVHYIQCKDDYTNLTELINYCNNNTEKCLDIGNNAKQLFNHSSDVTSLSEWIEEKLCTLD